MAFNWTCPHCQKSQSVTNEKFSRSVQGLGVKGLAEGDLCLGRQTIGCANPECEKVTLHVEVGPGYYNNGSYHLSGERIFSRTVVPEGAFKPQPDYIPAPLIEDYQEACLIRDLSPKASATLTRRCLQGMIRDFANIKKDTLDKEIKALRVAVADGSADRAISSESVEAIDQVRGVGNIGAHMEKDINLIIEVDPGEAQALIELVEMLFEEWYGARHRRQARLEHIAEIARSKKQAKKPVTAQPVSGHQTLNALMVDPSAVQQAVTASLAPAATGDNEGQG